MGTWESWERIFFSKNVDMAKQRVNEALFERLDVNLIGERTGFSALMLAVAFKHDDRLEIVKRLLARGAKVNIQCSDKNVSALHVAAQKGALDCVTLLLKHEADPTLVDSEGQTPGEVAYSELIDERNRVRQEIQEQCYCRLKHAREDWMQRRLKHSSATPEFRRNVLQSVYRGSPPAKASKKRNPSPEISSTEAIHGSADEDQKKTPLAKTSKDSPRQTTRQRVASGSRKSPFLRGSSTGRQSPHQLYINRPGLGKLEIINTPRKVVLEGNLFPSPRLSHSRSRNPSSRQRHQSDATDPFSPRVTPKPSEKSSEEAKKTEALEITALPRPTLTASNNSPRSAFVYPSPEKAPLQELSNNQTLDVTEASEDHSRCLFDDSDKEPSLIEKSHQDEKENSPGSATPRSFREFSTQTPPYLSPVSEVLCPSIPPVTVTPIAPAPSSGTTLKRQNEFNLRSKPLKLPVPKVPAALEETINNDSFNKSTSENLKSQSKTKDIPDPTCANSESPVVHRHSSNDAKSTLPKFQGSITETSLFEYFEKSLVLPNLATCDESSANSTEGSSTSARKPNRSSSSESVRRNSSKEGKCEIKENSKLESTQQAEIKEVDVSSDYHNNETFALQGGSRLESSREENPASPTQKTCKTPEKTISRKSSTASSSFSFPPPPDFIQSIVVHPSPEKRTPKKQKTGDVSENGNLDKSGLATVLFETNNSALPSMMPGSIIDLVNVPTEPPPPSLMMSPVKEEQILAEEHPANLTTSEGAQSFHLEYSFSSMENSIEIIEDGKSIARKVENLSATEEHPNLNLRKVSF